jgi:hypothetical protein
MLGLLIQSLALVGLVRLAAPFYGDGGISVSCRGVTLYSPTVSVKVVGDLKGFYALLSGYFLIIRFLVAV